MIIASRNIGDELGQEINSLCILFKVIAYPQFIESTI